MKNIVLSVSIFLFSLNLVAQGLQQITPEYLMQSQKVIKKNNDESKEYVYSTPREYSVKPTQSRSFSNGISEVIIGETYWDLQTNGAIQNRLFVHEDNTISATWIMSPDQQSGFPNRGTGYNYFDGESWMDMPTSRVEEGRTGWPSIAGLNGGEIIASHGYYYPDLLTTITTRLEKGSGDWNEELLPISGGQYYANAWPRMKVGGADGQSIHVISHTYGLDNNYITYSRSQNAGETFDIIDYLIPEIGPEFYNGFGGDNYALDVKGETIAIVIGGAWTDVVLVKSTDNGTTWTKTIVKEHPIPFWTDSILVDSLGFPDTDGSIENSDQSFSISLDANGDAHIFYGLMNYSNDEINDDSWSYYPTSDGLAYWNELTQTEEVIAYVADLNGNDSLDIELAEDGSALIAYYGSSLTSSPSSAIAENGDIYLIYSSIIEEFSQDQIDLGNFNDEIFLQHYRHQYIMRSQDGGTTWSTPYDLMTETTDPLTGNTLQEGVFGCISNIVNDNIYLTYQRDIYPGLNIQGDEDPITTNSIVFMTIPVESFENGFIIMAGCSDETACNYNTEFDCIYPGENEFADHIEWFLDVEQIENSFENEEYLVFVQGSDVFNQGTNLYSEWTTVYLEGNNVFSQGTELLIYGVTEFLDIIVDEINTLFTNYDQSNSFDCNGCINDVDGNNICDEFIEACPSPEFLEYNPLALSFDESLCETLIVNGCMTPVALNYNEFANQDDNSCIHSDYSFCDDFEMYMVSSNLAEASDIWTTWGASMYGETPPYADDVLIGNDNSFSGNNSLYLSADSLSGGPQDLVLPLEENYTNGQFLYSMNMFIPESKEAYFNLQTNQTAGIGWALSCHFFNTGELILYGENSSDSININYPTNEWFSISIDVNMITNNWELSINDAYQGSFYNQVSSIGGVDIFPLAGNEFWVDDVCYSYSYEEILGCTYPSAINFNHEATNDDGSCMYPELNLTIAEIQGMQEESPYLGQMVTTTGLVVAISESTYFLQSDVGAWSGVYVYSTNDSLEVGNQISITAIVSEYSGATQLSNVNSITVLSSDSPTIVTNISAAMLNTEAYEGVLVTVDTLKCIAEANNYGEAEFTGTIDTIISDDMFLDFTPTLGAYYRITGVVHYNYGNYRINPRWESDVIEYIVGCMDASMFNYNPTATLELDNSCQAFEIISGCIDPEALNYCPECNDDDGSCEYNECILPSYWSTINTGSNQTFMIPAGVTLNDEIIANGSAIGLFFINALGEYQCAGYTTIDGETNSVAAMADDSTTPEIDGLIEGAELIWVLWDGSLCDDMLIFTTYSGGPNVFTTNGISFVESFTSTTCQEIDFPEGWFIYSSFIQVENMDVVDLFSPIYDAINIIKDNDGEVYLPEWNYNGIGEVQFDQGYQVKTYYSTSLEFCGTQIMPEENPISLNEGWSIVSYLREESASVDIVMTSLLENDNLIIVKDYAGEVYLPEWDFNGIGEMHAGQGYRIKLNEAAVLQYLSNNESYRLTSLVHPDNTQLQYFSKALITDNNMTIVIKDEAWDRQPTEGSEIAVFDKNRNLVGSSVYTSPVTVVTVWGDDQSTVSKDGLEHLEHLYFQVEIANSIRNFTISDWKEGSSNYQINAINVAASITTESVNIPSANLFDAIPNPTNSITSISFYTPEKTPVNITVYNVLGELVEVLTDVEFESGRHSLDLNSAHLESGMYYFTMRTNGFEKTKRLIVYNK